ncbi:UDP-N-acetylmuramate dehydrogenase [Candidatus Finniella inopinata]|uniref:UDP-N-acetylenolpyruvoylglucosamine reductase n=1 Tax=Candidatus Finniella inopinata TaxID=1696036 RepID=A0A4Q7DHX2_9PROT|nr:UDP-N-acetylmuramate dehydrogenase [Candidatus Finniella inopinata]RZI45950.1 UDP-N-acetylmuramate dehydrogenase [Candidatus Finniella inopinata]
MIKLSSLPSLPAVRGRYEFDVPLSQSTWFRVGGPAEVIFKPADLEDLCQFLSQKPSNLSCYPLGAGSNVLVADAGLPGCVIRLGRTFATIEQQGNLVILGAGCLDRTVALTTCQWALSGLEFLVGIPGTIGGAIAMNAGAYGHEVKDRLQWVEWVTPQGKVERIAAHALNMTYREGHLPEGVIVTKAAFLCDPKPSPDIQLTLDAFLSEREKSQPIRGRTGGSTFKNPPDGLKAWQLIDQAGCRGLKIGDAQVSEKHCNFLLNLDAASAADLEQLGNTVQKRVYDQTGIMLEWEIIRLG